MLQEILAQTYVGLEWLTLVITVLIALSSMDDMAIDVWYWWRRFQRWRIRRQGRIHPLQVQQLLERAEQPLAIMVPAWKEYDVIAQMIETMVATMNYKNYVIFVGTYCNDDATTQEVDRMRRRYRQLQRVEVPNPGPTCKADCLNWVIQAIAQHEQKNDIEFAGMILHDSEDVLHPLEFKFFNYLLPRMDLIQLPVFSLERHWYELVAGTYMDEFAEAHGKDMLVREHIAGVVPSSGVGTCFSRKAIRALCDAAENQPFNTSSLTEDYDIGNRLAAMGMRSIFAVMPVQYVDNMIDSSGKVVEKRFVKPLSVREFFPDTFVTAYRQRSRWTLGICLQSWEQLNFTGSLAARYLMLRDRKGVVTSLISVAAYFALLSFITFHVLAAANVWTMFYPSVFLFHEWFHYILIFNAIGMVSRVFHRVYFVTEMYNWRQGLLSLPRMIVGNFINFMAVMRAWRMFLRYLLLGKKMVWDKTMHDFPTVEGLGKKRRIGDLLTTWQAVEPEKLELALHAQQNMGMPLGRVLVMNGWLDEETLAEAIAYQTGFDRIEVNVPDVLSWRHTLPYDLCARLRVLHLGFDAHQKPIVAVAGPLSDAGLAQVSEALHAVPVMRVARESEIRAGLRSLCADSPVTSDADATKGDLSTTPSGNMPLLGDLLIHSGLIDRAQFEAVLAVYSPSTHGRIGAYLVEKGVVTAEQVESALRRQREAYRAESITENLGTHEA